MRGSRDVEVERRKRAAGQRERIRVGEPCLDDYESRKEMEQWWSDLIIHWYPYVVDIVGLRSSYSYLGS